MTEPGDTLRVSKKISLKQPGALKLVRKYGDALICVRYRVNAGPLHRYTTVNVVMDRVLIVKWVNCMVGLQVLCKQTALQSAVRANGATWDKPGVISR